MVAGALLTIEEFERLPDEVAKNYELDDGILVDVSGNTGGHNDLRDLLIEIARPHVRKNGLGLVLSEQEFDFNGNAHGPDVSFIGPAKRALYDRKRRVQRFVPDLAIEIVSGNDRFEDLMRKALRYRACGTSEVWIFSIDGRQAFHYSPTRQVILNENGLFAPEQIPGLSIRIGELLDMLA